MCRACVTDPSLRVHLCRRGRSRTSTVEVLDLTSLTIVATVDVGPQAGGIDVMKVVDEKRSIIPTFEFNAEQSKASRAKVEAFVKEASAPAHLK